MTTGQQQFPGSMRFLHWLMAVLVLVMLGIGIGMLLEYVLMKLAKYYS